MKLLLKHESGYMKFRISDHVLEKANISSGFRIYKFNKQRVGCERADFDTDPSKFMIEPDFVYKRSFNWTL